MNEHDCEISTRKAYCRGDLWSPVFMSACHNSELIIQISNLIRKSIDIYQKKVYNKDVVFICGILLQAVFAVLF